MRLLLAIALLFALVRPCLAQDALEAPAPLPADPSLYSFADIYSITVAGGEANRFFTRLPGEAPAARFALFEGPIAPELRFSVVGVPQPRGWMLLLAGAALAAWVARQRLGYRF